MSNAKAQISNEGLGPIYTAFNQSMTARSASIIWHWDFDIGHFYPARSTPEINWPPMPDLKIV
jgi:hypothetical protein